MGQNAKHPENNAPGAARATLGGSVGVTVAAQAWPRAGQSAARLRLTAALKGQPSLRGGPGRPTREDGTGERESPY